MLRKSTNSRVTIEHIKRIFGLFAMMNSKINPTLLTFCFVKDTFDRDGDLVLGLVPLFVPIASSFAGRKFDPKEFVEAVRAFYGISMPVAAAEEIAIRMCRRNYLKAVGDDKYAQEFYYLDNYGATHSGNPENKEIISAEINSLLAHVRQEYLKLYPGKINFPLETEVLEILVNLNFSTNQFDLSLTPEDTFAVDGTQSNLVALRILVADYIYQAKNQNIGRFDCLRQICAGAMLAQVILTVKNPPKKGVEARSLTVFFDTPLILQFFGFEGQEKQRAVQEIILSLKKLKASWGVYRQNIDEMRDLLNAVMESIKLTRRAEYEVGRHTAASQALQTRARELLSNPDGLLKKVGFRIIDPETFSDGVKSGVPERFEMALTGKIRPMGKIYSREVDASAVCDTVRQRQSQRVADALRAFALFVSPNRQLVSVASYQGNRSRSFSAAQTACGC